MIERGDSILLRVRPPDRRMELHFRLRKPLAPRAFRQHPRPRGKPSADRAEYDAQPRGTTVAASEGERIQRRHWQIASSSPPGAKKSHPRAAGPCKLR